MSDETNTSEASNNQSAAAPAETSQNVPASVLPITGAIEAGSATGMASSGDIVMDAKPAQDMATDRPISQEQAEMRAAAFAAALDAQQKAAAVQPPVDNDHVADGAEPFSDPVIEANKLATPRDAEAAPPPPTVIDTKIPPGSLDGRQAALQAQLDRVANGITLPPAAPALKGAQDAVQQEDAGRSVSGDGLKSSGADYAEPAAQLPDADIQPGDPIVEMAPQPAVVPAVIPADDVLSDATDDGLVMLAAAFLPIEQIHSNSREEVIAKLQAIRDKTAPPPIPSDDELNEQNDHKLSTLAYAHSLRPKSRLHCLELLIEARDKLVNIGKVWRKDLQAWV